MTISSERWQALSEAAWAVQQRARLVGDTKVGAAVLADNDTIYVGCNVEHKFRAHDVHAEVNALTNMIAAGGTRAIAVLIVSNRERFTPCGGCLDWIFELGGEDTLVAFEPRPGAKRETYRADQLMPFYPR